MPSRSDDNVPAWLALIATVATWSAIPLLWSFNEWGVLSVAEILWLLLVVATWLVAVAGVVQARADDALFAALVFACSSAVPVALPLVLGYWLALGVSVD